MSYPSGGQKIRTRHDTCLSLSLSVSLSSFFISLSLSFFLFLQCLYVLQFSLISFQLNVSLSFPSVLLSDDFYRLFLQSVSFFNLFLSPNNYISFFFASASFRHTSQESFFDSHFKLSFNHWKSFLDNFGPECWWIIDNAANCSSITN
jgi:hypothetical protein